MLMQIVFAEALPYTYTQAVIFETQRLANAVPIPYRSTSQDVELDGYISSLRTQ